MKKIITIITFIFSLILLTSCFGEQERSKFDDMMQIPVNEDYVLVSRTGITKNQEVHYFNEMCISELKKMGMQEKEINTYSISHTTILFDNYIFVQFRYSYEEDNNSDMMYNYIFCFYNLETLDQKIIRVEHTKNLMKITRIGKYAVIEYIDHLLLIDSKTYKEETVDFREYQIIQSSGDILLIQNLNTGMYMYYNASLDLIEVDIPITSRIQNVTNDYIEYYITDDGTYIYQIGTNQIYTKNHYLEKYPIEEKHYKLNIINDNEFTVTIYEEVINFNIDDIRSYSSVFRQIESIFDTTITLQHLYMFNDEYYLVFGNTDSFFGAYQQGCTLPAVFKINDQHKLEYIGFLPNVHDGSSIHTIYKK